MCTIDNCDEDSKLSLGPECVLEKMSTDDWMEEEPDTSFSLDSDEYDVDTEDAQLPEKNSDTQVRHTNTEQSKLNSELIEENSEPNGSGENIDMPQCITSEEVKVTSPIKHLQALDEETYDVPLKKIKLHLVPIDNELCIDEYGTFLCHSNDSNTGSVEDKVSPSLPWYEARYHTCLICNQQYPLGSMNGHVNETHNLSMYLYKEKFPQDDFSAKNWTCSICNKVIKWTSQSIRSHLRSNHNMSTNDYASSVTVTYTHLTLPTNREV